MNKGLVLAAVLAASAMGASAHATTFFSLGAPAADGSISGSFGNDGVSKAGISVDTFSFNLPAMGDTTATISSSATTLKGKIIPTTNIDFQSVTLDGQAFGLTPTGQFEFGSLDLTTLKGPQTLVVTYKSGGPGASYSGTLAFSPTAVPEPAAWALMITGMGVVGAAMRRQQRGVVALQA